MTRIVHPVEKRLAYHPERHRDFIVVAPASFRNFPATALAIVALAAVAAILWVRVRRS